VTADTLIDDILRREGGYVDHPNDRGSCTNHGITSVTLGEWRQLGRRATCDEVKALAVDGRGHRRQMWWRRPPSPG
jgi:lysozyme family protein